MKSINTLDQREHEKAAMIKIFRAITFHFREDRLPLIPRLVGKLENFSFDIKTIIVTNTDRPSEVALLKE